MTHEEKIQYMKLSKTQKDFVNSLVALGFTWKYFNSYEKLDWGIINVSKFERWSDLLKCVHELGKDQKRFEMQRVLGI